LFSASLFALSPSEGEEPNSNELTKLSMETSGLNTEC